MKKTNDPTTLKRLFDQFLPWVLLLAFVVLFGASVSSYLKNSFSNTTNKIETRQQHAR